MLHQQQKKDAKKMFMVFFVTAAVCIPVLETSQLAGFRLMTGQALS